VTKTRLVLAAAVAAACLVVLPLRAAQALKIYFIDTEGGQSTLLVTPAGQSLLIDTGFPGEGRFSSKPGDPKQARDANRVLAAARDAGISRIDVLVVSHAHADHIGGVTELAAQMPIEVFVDNGGPLPNADAVAGTLEAFKWYEAVRAKGRHIVAKPGERLPLKGVDATVVTAAGKTLTTPLKGAGEAVPSCTTATPPQEPTENPRSVAVVVQYGQFRYFDPGDLTGEPLFALTCPKDMLGRIDVYRVAHHGGADAADPATFAALRPRAAIVINGPMKGGAPNLLAELRKLPGIDTWQLHHSLLPGAEDVAPERIANLDTSTAHWLSVTANSDGSFAITNPRTGATKTYPKR
jgi:beta-lactamase superfamily II metal-dependent hydrolase